MKWIGLTGGIGVGKSSVCQIITKHSLPVIEADKIVHTLLLKQEIKDKIVNTFGESSLDKLGEIDRKKLAKIVFVDKTKLNQLENMVHPIVKNLVQEHKKKLSNEGNKIAFYDVPLLFEHNMQTQFDEIVLVASYKNLVIDRLIKKGFSTHDISNRVRHQVPQEDKLGQASYVIWNNGTLDDLEKSCNKMLKSLTSKS